MAKFVMEELLRELARGESVEQLKKDFDNALQQAQTKYEYNEKIFKTKLEQYRILSIEVLQHYGIDTKDLENLNIDELDTCFKEIANLLKPELVPKKQNYWTLTFDKKNLNNASSEIKDIAKDILKEYVKKL